MKTHLFIGKVMKSSSDCRSIVLVASDRSISDNEQKMLLKKVIAAAIANNILHSK